jgi:putative transposase
MEITKAYRFRIYPNQQQQESLARTFGSCRFIWNYYLGAKSETYNEAGVNLKYKEISSDMTQLRRQIPWLGEVQFQPLQQTLRNLDQAYQRFFKKQNGFPNFKKKYNNRQSFQKAIGWKLIGNKLQIQKDIVVRTRGGLPRLDCLKMGTLTVSRKNNLWYASIVVQEEIDLPKEYIAPLGLDLGIKDLVITSDGEKYENINLGKKMLKKLRKLQRSFARKKKGGVNRSKERVAIARLHSKIANSRSNHLHQVSKTIVDKNHVMIGVENLSVANMMKNHTLARAISDASWAELVRQIEYKQRWRGGEFVKVDRFFPSSKMCSDCHHILKKMDLSMREWECPKCFVKHDRDINSAINILQQARSLLGVEEGDGRGSAGNLESYSSDEARISLSV